MYDFYLHISHASEKKKKLEMPLSRIFQAVVFPASEQKSTLLGPYRARIEHYWNLRNWRKWIWLMHELFYSCSLWRKEILLLSDSHCNPSLLLFSLLWRWGFCREAEAKKKPASYVGWEASYRFSSVCLSTKAGLPKSIQVCSSPFRNKSTVCCCICIFWCNDLLQIAVVIDFSSAD